MAPKKSMWTPFKSTADKVEDAVEGIVKPKKKAAKRKAKVSKPLVKQVLPKSKKSKKVKAAKPKPSRRSLDKTLDISTSVVGSVVVLHVNTGPTVTDIEIAVNGRGVWKGQP